MITIESGHKAKPKKQGRKWKYPIPDLQVGDSIRVPIDGGDADKLRNNLMKTAQNYKHRTGKKWSFKSWIDQEKEAVFLKRVK